MVVKVVYVLNVALQGCVIQNTLMKVVID